jgi:hypothetical protein
VAIRRSGNNKFVYIGYDVITALIGAPTRYIAKLAVLDFSSGWPPTSATIHSPHTTYDQTFQSSISQSHSGALNVWTYYAQSSDACGTVVKGETSTHMDFTVRSEIDIQTDSFPIIMPADRAGSSPAPTGRFSDYLAGNPVGLDTCAVVSWVCPAHYATDPSGCTRTSCNDGVHTDTKWDEHICYAKVCP